MNKVEELLNAIKSAPMRKQDAGKMIGAGSLFRLTKSGVFAMHLDEDPDYLTGVRGKKPMCLWITKGNTEYRQAKKTRDKQKIERFTKKIAASISFLNSKGYTVLPPNV